MKSILRRFMGLVLALALVFSISIPIYAAENWEERLNSEISSAVLERDNSYTRYCIANKSKPLATDDIIINPTSYSSAAPNTALVKIEDHEIVDVYDNYDDIIKKLDELD